MAGIIENMIIMAILIAGLVTVLAIGVFIANTAVHFIRDRRTK